MKKSRYNLFLNLEDTKLAFNGMTCALAEVDGEFDKIYSDIENVDINLIDEKSKKLISDMKAGGYILFHLLLLLLWLVILHVLIVMKKQKVGL